jgi:hypothetical protein
MMKITTISLFIGLMATPALAQVDCSQFNIDPTASQSLGPASTLSPGACHTRMSHGFPVPDPACTPGAINPTVTEDVLRNPAFRTSCVRSHATTEEQKFATYGYYNILHPVHNSGLTQTCELDHLVPLELGGADTLDNIWPQCGSPSGDVVLPDDRFFKQKDMVENYLARMVRDGKMKQSDAQKGIATDWTQYLDAARNVEQYSR